MERMLEREQRGDDVALISNLERAVGFFASTSILVLAGLVASLAVTDKISLISNSIPYSEDQSPEEIQFKLMLLISIFVYAFFTFTWSMRQFGFSSVLLGAAPRPNDRRVDDIVRQNLAKQAAKVLDYAGHSYNYGLRSYYFAMAVLPWFISSWLFIAAVALVIGVLYHREFKSLSSNVLKTVEGAVEPMPVKTKDDSIRLLPTRIPVAAQDVD